MRTTTFDKFVFDTDNTILYRFPTHSTELVMDRSEAATSEVFIVILQPGEAPPLHVHHDTEQVFYVLQGSGELQTGPDGGQRAPLTAGNLVRIPPGTYHRILCQSAEPMRYLSVDCFLGGCPTEEPAWESHLRVVCQENGWDFTKIRDHGSK
jgi:mannose-6-phosphate isomerase-like protein (cupin superfamily)